MRRSIIVVRVVVGWEFWGVGLVVIVWIRCVLCVLVVVVGVFLRIIVLLDRCWFYGLVILNICVWGYIVIVELFRVGFWIGMVGVVGFIVGGEYVGRGCEVFCGVGFGLFVVVVVGVVERCRCVSCRGVVLYKWININVVFIGRVVVELVIVYFYLMDLWCSFGMWFWYVWFFFFWFDDFIMDFVYMLDDEECGGNNDDK